MKLIFHGRGPFGWLLAFVLLASVIFFEALHGPTIDNRIIPNLDKMAHVAAFGFVAPVSAFYRLCQRLACPAWGWPDHYRHGCAG